MTRIWRGTNLQNYIPADVAVRFARQAQFHPLKFLKHIATSLTVYENTAVRSVENGLIQTTRGNVRAEQIVFVCHYPFINFPGMYFARMHQQRSYVLALANAAQVDGMWIGAGPSGFSFRNYGDLLLLGGGGHRLDGETVYATISNRAAERLELEKGDSVLIVIKASSVMVGLDEDE